MPNADSHARGDQKRQRGKELKEVRVQPRPEDIFRRRPARRPHPRGCRCKGTGRTPGGSATPAPMPRPQARAGQAAPGARRGRACAARSDTGDPSRPSGRTAASWTRSPVPHPSPWNSAAALDAQPRRPPGAAAPHGRTGACYHGKGKAALRLGQEMSAAPPGRAPPGCRNGRGGRIGRHWRPMEDGPGPEGSGTARRSRPGTGTTAPKAEALDRVSHPCRMAPAGALRPPWRSAWRRRRRTRPGPLLWLCPGCGRRGRLLLPPPAGARRRRRDLRGPGLPRRPGRNPCRAPAAVPPGANRRTVRPDPDDGRAGACGRRPGPGQRLHPRRPARRPPGRHRARLQLDVERPRRLPGAPAPLHPARPASRAARGRAAGGGRTLPVRPAVARGGGGAPAATRPAPAGPPGPARQRHAPAGPLANALLLAACRLESRLPGNPLAGITAMAWGTVPWIPVNGTRLARGSGLHQQAGRGRCTY